MSCRIIVFGKPLQEDLLDTNVTYITTLYCCVLVRNAHWPRKSYTVLSLFVVYYVQCCSCLSFCCAFTIYIYIRYYTHYKYRNAACSIHIVVLVGSRTL